MTHVQVLLVREGRSQIAFVREDHAKIGVRLELEETGEAWTVREVYKSSATEPDARAHARWSKKSGLDTKRRRS